MFSSSFPWFIKTPYDYYHFLIGSWATLLAIIGLAMSLSRQDRVARHVLLARVALTCLVFSVSALMWSQVNQSTLGSISEPSIQVTLGEEFVIAEARAGGLNYQSLRLIDQNGEDVDYDDIDLEDGLWLGRIETVCVTRKVNVREKSHWVLKSPPDKTLHLGSCSPRFQTPQEFGTIGTTRDTFVVHLAIGGLVAQTMALLWLVGSIIAATVHRHSDLSGMP